jgi:hypothetical protein
MGYCNDMDLILPIEKNNEVGKLLKENSSCPVQIGRMTEGSRGGGSKAGEQLIPKSSSSGKAALGAPDCCEIGIAPGSLVKA